MLSPSVPPDTDREVLTSPSGIDIPARKPVFFCPLTFMNAVANTDARPTGNDKVRLAMSERTSAPSRDWVKPALTLALKNGSGTPNEMRLSIFGGCAVVNSALLPAVAFCTDVDR